ncbi:MAG: hypothetical protein E7617_05320 [Ruminococcaceae bacterium]|nr:hypothetical protein [Oscillospiraceae bacterium]
MSIQNELIGIIGSAVFGTEAPKVSAEKIPELYSLAEGHDLTHLLAEGLERSSALPEGELGATLKNKKFTAVMRHSRIAAELDALCELLSERGIDHLPLKGSAMRHLYPKPWMRTSCDIDILVRPSDLDAAIAAIVGELEYEYKGTEDHNATLYSPSGVCLELHYKLIRSDYVDRAEKPLADLWDRLIPDEALSHKLHMSDELFYYYHIAHAAKHYTYGGTGIRTVLDTYILNEHAPGDAAERERLLCEGGLLEFEKNLRHLAMSWFGGGEETALDREMAQYITRSGVYGRIDHTLALRRAKRGGRFKYLLSRIFVPYGVYKKDHPLVRMAALRYLFWLVARLFKPIFKKEVRRRMASEARENAAVSDLSVEKIYKHISRVGLADLQ